MEKSSFASIGSAILLALCFTTVSSGNSIQFIGSTLPTDLSQNGAVVVGNLPTSFETFRWTEETGVVPLGRATVPTLGTGAGSPDVSWDGTKVSATILSDDGTKAVPGRWTLDSGWEQLGPLPPNAVTTDNNVASAWGLSGDGNTAVGLYWISGKAHAYHWASGTGMVDLGATVNKSSRASAVSYDGSVVGGFDASPTGFPSRLPTVWVNGAKTVLGTSLVDSEVYSVNANGTVVGGSWRDANDPVRGAAIWRFDGSNWNLQKLGVLPGTMPDTPGAIVTDMTADGSIAVGHNQFNIDFSNNAAGFYWSQATGMISADQLLSRLGLSESWPAAYQLADLTSISPDGSTIAGIAIDLVGGTGYQGFLISITGWPGDFNHDETVDAADYVVWRKGLDTIYTQNDYDVWRAHFGETAGSSGTGATTSAAVPEPATLTLMSLAAACGYFRRRRAE